MSAAALVARLLLAVLFAIAGVAKLRDRPGTQSTLEDFGLPTPLSGPGALLLPLAELTVAGLLLPDATAPAGAIGAIALLGVFIAAITVNLARGRRPDCNCFGQIHSEPVGPLTLVRNAALMVLAGFVLASGQRSAASSALDNLGALDTPTVIALAALGLAVAALVILGWLALHLLRQQGRVLLRLDALDGGAGTSAQMPAPAPAGLPVGAPAPAFELPTTDGSNVALAQLIGGGRPLGLAFVDPGCGPCRSLLPRLAARQGEAQGPPLAVVISGEDADAARAMAAEHDLSQALLDHDGSVRDAYEVPGTPMAVAIGRDGLIRSESAAGPDEVLEMLDRLDRRERNGFQLPVVRVGNGDPGGAGDDDPGLGELIPDVELEDIDGEPTSLSAAVGGAPHLVLFWSPTCGFCEAMIDAVRALGARDDLPPVLLVATGDAEANRAQRLGSRTLLDPGFEGMGAVLTIAGTPSALRLDADGRVASRLAIGADSVLRLAGVGRESSATDR